MMTEQRIRYWRDHFEQDAIKAVEKRQYEDWRYACFQLCAFELVLELDCDSPFTRFPYPYEKAPS